MESYDEAYAAKIVLENKLQIEARGGIVPEPAAQVGPKFHHCQVVLDSYLKHLRSTTKPNGRKYRESAIKARESDIRAFVEFTKRTYVEQITKQDFKNYWEHLKALGRSNENVINKFTSICSWLRKNQTVKIQDILEPGDWPSHNKVEAHPLSKLVLVTYLTEAFYVFVVLGIIAYFFGFNLIHFITYIGDEIVLVIGTSSSESVLPQLMQKLERFGASRSVVDLVLPTGYAFNLGGLALSLPISTVFIAQVYHVELSFSRLLALVAIMLLTSKGAAGVTGAAFIVLATTVGASGILPLEGLALVFAVDNFLSMARALANVIGNGVATIVVAKLENEFSPEPASVGVSQ
jgi:hypothetical protein